MGNPVLLDCFFDFGLLDPEYQPKTATKKTCLFSNPKSELLKNDLPGKTQFPGEQDFSDRISELNSAFLGQD